MQFNCHVICGVNRLLRHFVQGRKKATRKSYKVTKNSQGHEFQENPRRATSYPGYCVGFILCNIISRILCRFYMLNLWGKCES